MKRLLCMSACISALILQPTHTMNQGAQRARQVSLSDPGSVIKFKRALAEALALCSRDEDDDETFNVRDLLKILVKNVKNEALAKVLGIEPETFVTYFNPDSFKRFIECILNKASLQEKAYTFTHLFKSAAWEQEIDCIQFSQLIEVFSQIIFFEGSDQNFNTLISQLKDLLQRIESPQKLERFISRQKIIELIDKKVRGEPVTIKEVMAALTFDTVASKSSLKKYIDIHNCLIYLRALCTQSEDGAHLYDLCACIQWGTLLLEFPSITGFNDTVLSYAFNRQSLGALLSKFQRGTEITAQDIEESINQTTLTFLGIPLETLPQYIDCTLLARGLNALRKGEPSPDIAQAIKSEKLFKLLGFETRKVDWKTFIQNGVPFLGAGIALPYAGRMICNDGVELLTPHHWVPAFLICALIIYGTYLLTKHLKNLPLSQVIILNASMNALEKRVETRLQETTRPLKYYLGTLVPRDNPNFDAYQAFLEMLTEEHMAELNSPHSMATLFEKPIDFLKNEGRFIKKICTGGGAVRALDELLEQVIPFDRLPHAEAFTDFSRKFLTHPASKDLISLLPPHVFDLARFYPLLLWNYIAFTAKLKDKKWNGESLQDLLAHVIQKAENPNLPAQAL